MARNRTDKPAQQQETPAPRRNHSRKRGSVGLPQGAVPLMDAVHQDRQERRDERQAWIRAQRERQYSQAAEPLREYGATLVPASRQQRRGGITTRPLWNEKTSDLALALLKTYFLGNPTEVLAAEQALGDKQGVIDQTRQRFASACVFDTRIKNTVGQEQTWFPALLAEAQALHNARHAKAAGDNKPGPNGTSTASEVTADQPQLATA